MKPGSGSWTRSNEKQEQFEAMRALVVVCVCDQAALCTTVGCCCCFFFLHNCSTRRYSVLYNTIHFLFCVVAIYWLNKSLQLLAGKSFIALLLFYFRFFGGFFWWRFSRSGLINSDSLHRQIQPAGVQKQRRGRRPAVPVPPQTRRQPDGVPQDPPRRPRYCERNLVSSSLFASHCLV